MALQTFDALRLISPKTSSLQEIMGKELDNSFNRVRNKYAEPMAQTTLGLNAAQAQEHQAKAAQAQQDMQLLRAIFGGELGGSQNMGAPGGMPDMQGQGMPQNEQPSMSMQGAPQGSSMSQPMPQSGQQNGMSSMMTPELKQAFKEGYIRNKGHIPQAHHQILPSGEAATYDALKGGWNVQQLGRTPEDIAMGTELAKHNVDTIKQNYETYSGAIAQKPNLQGVLKMIENPKFEQSVGPWKNVAAKYLAPDDVKEMQASFSTLGKNIVTEAAKGFGATLTNQEMSWLQGVLPNPSDTFPAIKGKVKTLELLRAATEQKAILKDQLLRTPGIDPIIADQIADSKIDYNAIRRELKPTISMRNKEGNIIDVSKYDDALIKRAKSKGYEEGDY